MTPVVPCRGQTPPRQACQAPPLCQPLLSRGCGCPAEAFVDTQNYVNGPFLARPYFLGPPSALLSTSSKQRPSTWSTASGQAHAQKLEGLIAQTIWHWRTLPPLFMRPHSLGRAHWRRPDCQRGAAHMPWHMDAERFQ